MSNSRPLAKLIPLLASCLLAQGCVGFFVDHTKTTTFQKPTIGDTPAISAVGGGTRRKKEASAAWLETQWGKPECVTPVTTEPQGELWTYKFNTVWYGVIPCVVVPIPLILPLGKEKVVFFVKEGQIVSADVVKSKRSGAGAGLFGPEGLGWAGGSW